MLHVNQLIGFGAGGGLNSGPIQFVGGKVGVADDDAGDQTVSLTSGLTGGIRSSVQPGDLIIAGQVTGGNAFGAPPVGISDGSADYTTLYSYTGWKPKFIAGMKFVDGDTQTIFDGSGSLDIGSAYGVYVFSGVDMDDPLDVAVTTAFSSEGTNRINPAAITPVTAGAYIVCIGGVSHQGSGTATCTSSDLTDFLSAGNGELNADATIGVGHKPNWVSGAFDPAVWGFTQADDSGDGYACVTIALRPAQ